MSTTKYPRRAPRLAFQGKRPAFEPGRGYMTMRMGDKWMGTHLDGKNEVVLIGPDSKPFGVADIISVYYMPLDLVPECLLLWNYDPAYHTPAGALAGLRQVYGNAEIPDRIYLNVQPDSEVSIVFFQVRDEEECK